MTKSVDFCGLERPI